MGCAFAIASRPVSRALKDQLPYRRSRHAAPTAKGLAALPDGLRLPGPPGLLLDGTKVSHTGKE